jgi:hypothetical protein
MYIADRRLIGSQSRSYVWADEGLGQPGPEEEVKKLMKQLRPLFQKAFSKNKIVYGNGIVGKAVSFRVLADKDFKAELGTEAKRAAANVMPSVLKFAPEIVKKRLVSYYQGINERFPARLNTIDENTKLTADEKAIVFAMAHAQTLKKVKDDADNVDGFYSPSSKEIIFRDTLISAGAVAHEMAHAYADQGWRDFIRMMQLRGMKETDKLDEGMTTYIASIVVTQWHAKQPSKTIIPSAGYDATYTDRAREFVKQLGDHWAYEAYFGGWIDFTDTDNPEDTLLIGKAKKTQKKWKWPWR